MRGFKLTYPLIALAVIPAALVSLNKINKVSFFDHYFKVIEEVELRNSHELEEGELFLWVQFFSQNESQGPEISPSPAAQDHFSWELLTPFLPVRFILRSVPDLTGARIFHLLTPCRAP